MSIETETGFLSEQYTTAEFRKSMASAFETARYQDKIVQVNHHGRPWVSIVSPENAAAISRLNSVGKVKKAELGKLIDTFENDVEIEELIDKLDAIRKMDI